MTDLERSTFQTRACYRYVRSADRLPSTAEARAAGLEAVVKVKLFGGPGTWYITGYDPDSRLATGAVDLGYGPEVGDFWMGELVAFRFPRTGLPLERDLYWTPCPLAQAAGHIFEDGEVLA